MGWLIPDSSGISEAWPAVLIDSKMEEKYGDVYLPDGWPVESQISALFPKPLARGTTNEQPKGTDGSKSK